MIILKVIFSFGVLWLLAQTYVMVLFPNKEISRIFYYTGVAIYILCSMVITFSGLLSLFIEI